MTNGLKIQTQIIRTVHYEGRVGDLWLQIFVSARSIVETSFDFDFVKAGQRRQRVWCPTIRPCPTENELLGLIAKVADNLRKYSKPVRLKQQPQKVETVPPAQQPHAPQDRRRTVKVPVAIVTSGGVTAGVQQLEIPVGDKSKPSRTSAAGGKNNHLQPLQEIRWKKPLLVPHCLARIRARPPPLKNKASTPKVEAVPKEPAEEDAGSLPPWAPAAAGAAAGGAAALGALLSLAASGIRPGEVWESARDLFGQGQSVQAAPPEQAEVTPAFRQGGQGGPGGFGQPGPVGQPAFQ